MLCVDQLVLIFCKLNWSWMGKIGWWVIMLPAEIVGLIFIVFILLLIYAYIKGFNE